MKNFNEFRSKSKNLKIEISEDNLSAYLTILNTDEMFDENEIVEFINDLDITNGLDEAANYNNEKKLSKEIGERFLIAKCDIDCGSSEIEYLFDSGNCIVPKADVDILKINELERTFKNQKIALVSTAAAGSDIFGKTINDSNIVNVNDKLGENVYFSNEDNSIRAEKNGYLYLTDDGKINVKNDIFIKESIDGKLLELFGNVTVKGIINESHIVISGNLTVYGNIQNCIEKGIIVDGDIAIDYAENVKIVSNGKITISNSIKNCIIQATGKIIGSDKSSVSGSLMQSGESIEMANVGSPFPILTELEITFSPYKKMQLLKLQNKLNTATQTAGEDKEELEKISNKLAILKEEFTTEMETFLNRNIEEFNFKINSVIYEDSYFRILNHSITINKETQRSQILVKNNTLEINAIDRI